MPTEKTLSSNLSRKHTARPGLLSSPLDLGGPWPPLSWGGLPSFYT